jgi:glutathione S-transferase
MRRHDDQLALPFDPAAERRAKVWLWCSFLADAEANAAMEVEAYGVALDRSGYRHREATPEELAEARKTGRVALKARRRFRAKAGEVVGRKVNAADVNAAWDAFTTAP